VPQCPICEYYSGLSIPIGFASNGGLLITGSTMY
jgi:hypothetical protein